MSTLRIRTLVMFLLVLFLLTWSGYQIIANADLAKDMKPESGPTILHSNDIMLEEGEFSTQDIWNPQEPFRLPLPPEGMIWEEVVVDYRVTIDLPNTGMVETALSIGLIEAQQGTHEYLLHSAMIDKFREKGISVEILGGVTRFILKRDPAELMGAADEKDPVEGYVSQADMIVQDDGSCANSSNEVYLIEDMGFQRQGVLIPPISCEVAEGAYVTEVVYSLTIDDRPQDPPDDPLNFFCADYEITLETDTGKSLLVYDNLGGITDGETNEVSNDDDPEDDTDIELIERSTHYFDGESPNQTWWVRVEDTMSGGYGQLEYFEFEIWWDNAYVDLYDDNEQYRSFWPNSVCPDDPINPPPFKIDTIIRNGGNEDSGPFVVSFYASENPEISMSDYYIDQMTLANVEAQNKVYCNWDGFFPADPPIPGGSYWIGWIIDADGQVPEIDESNNTAYMEEYRLDVCDATASVDLLDERELWRSFSPQILNPALAIDDIKIQTYIRNNGCPPEGDTSDPYVVKFYACRDEYIPDTEPEDAFAYLDPTDPRVFEIGQVPMLELAPSNYGDCLFEGNIPADLPAAWYWIGWRIDADSNVAECDESNNIAYKEGYQLRVGIPDIVLVGTEEIEHHDDENDTIECGEDVELRITLENNSLLAATGVRGVLSTTDDYVVSLFGDRAWPDDIPPGGEATSEAFEFTLADEMPINHVIEFHLKVTSNETRDFIDQSWDFDITADVQCPLPEPKKISGEISLLDGCGDCEEVHLSLSGAEPRTVTATATDNGECIYTFEDLPHGTCYTILPNLQYYTFNPETVDICPLNKDETDVDFTANNVPEDQPFITGTVTVPGDCDVTQVALDVTAGMDGDLLIRVYLEADGSYEIPEEILFLGCSYTVTPTLIDPDPDAPDRPFYPPFRDYPDMYRPTRRNQDFEAGGPSCTPCRNLRAADSVTPVDADETKPVVISIDNASRLAGIDFVLKYNPAVIEAIGASQTEVTADWELQYDIDASGSISVSMAGTEGIAANEDNPEDNIATVHFRPLCPPDGDQTSTLELPIGDIFLYDDRGFTEVVCAQNAANEGTMSCGCPGIGKGDINGDDYVDSGDAILALRMSAELPIGVPEHAPNICDKWAGDVNCDGENDVLDVILIMQYAVGEITSFPACP